MNNRYCVARLLFAFLWLQCSIGATHAQPLPVHETWLEQYAEIFLTLPSEAEREAPLARLLEIAETWRNIHGDDPNTLITTARIRFAYADTQNRHKAFNGMKMLKIARDELELAITLDPSAQHGLPHAFLGFLYKAVPPWPFGFRNVDKSEAYFQQAMAIEGKNASKHLFLIMVLIQEERFMETHEQLVMAQVALRAEPPPTNLQLLLQRWIDNTIEGL